ncbi:hypothetical protein E4U58_003921, partial [Claviceps cyperi]
MAHDAQSAGAADLSGLGGTNVEAVTPKVITARERVPKHLKADDEKIASLVPSSALEGVWR